MRTLTTIELKGTLGNALRRSCDNRLKTVDYLKMAEPFILRNETDNGWRCEFWGKVIRSAILTNYWLKDAELARKIRGGIDAILEAQTPDGCISSYPVEKQCTGWDVWGRKYVLMGLMRYCEYVEMDPRVLDAAVRMTDQLFAQLRERGLSLYQCGMHGGLPATSIFTAVMELHSLTYEPRMLEYAREILELGASSTHDAFEAARLGCAPAEIGNAKAYELTSCFEGLADLHCVEPKQEYLESCVNYFNGVREREIFITGTGGLKDRNGEFWMSGALHQTQQGRGIGMLGETCITATWLHYCLKMAALLPNETVPFDEAERSIYNALLGAMTPDGSNWCHQNPTPLTGGPKMPSTDQILRGFGVPFDGHDCCRAQGPEGLACAPLFIFTADDGQGTLAVNLYEPLKAEFSDGTRLEITGSYPFSTSATLHLTSERELPLRLRIPRHCTGVLLNGNPLEAMPGSFLHLTRKWEADDTLELTFDLSPKAVLPPDGSAYTAVLCGPIVMAEDSRGECPDANLRATWNGHTLVDYITAGNAFSPENTLAVWLSAR